MFCVCVCFYKLKNDDCICFVLGFNDIYTTLINAIFSATYNFRLVRDIYICLKWEQYASIKVVWILGFMDSILLMMIIRTKSLKNTWPEGMPSFNTCTFGPMIGDEYRFDLGIMH